MSKAYAGFLHSPEWKVISAAVKKRDNYTCQMCHATGVKLVVHHLNYDQTSGKGLLDMRKLTTLCDTCHHKVHPDKNNDVDVVDAFLYCQRDYDTSKVYNEGDSALCGYPCNCKTCAFFKDCKYEDADGLCLRVDSPFFNQLIQDRQKTLCTHYFPWFDDFKWEKVEAHKLKMQIFSDDKLYSDLSESIGEILEDRMMKEMDESLTVKSNRVWHNLWMMKAETQEKLQYLERHRNGFIKRFSEESYIKLMEAYTNIDNICNEELKLVSLKRRKSTNSIQECQKRAHEDFVLTMTGPNFSVLLENLANVDRQSINLEKFYKA